MPVGNICAKSKNGRGEQGDGAAKKPERGALGEALLGVGYTLRLP